MSTNLNLIRYDEIWSLNEIWKSDAGYLGAASVGAARREK